MNRALRSFLGEHDLGFRQDADFSGFTTLALKSRVGTVVRIEQQRHLQMLMKVLRELGIPFFMVGGGSNIAPAQQINAVAVVNRAAAIKRAADGFLLVESGCSNAKFVAYCSRYGLGGAEFLAGIPGTLGGAAAVNAGAMQRGMSEIIETLTVISPDGREKEIRAAAAGFSYRDSALKKSGDVVTQLLLRVHPENPEIVRKIASANIAYRAQKHPSYRLHSAGCFFKNPIVGGRRISAGMLIQECGFAGFRKGNLYVSEQHANFIINSGKATLEEIMELENLIRDRIRSEKGLDLEREVVYINAAGHKH